MNLTHFTPANMPIPGRLVKEDFAAGQFDDCCLYVLPSNAEAFEEEGKKVFEETVRTIGESKLLNKYDYAVLDKMPLLDNHPTLSKAIKEEQCHFLMPLYTPSKAGKQYLLMKTQENKMVEDVALLIYASERISKDSVNELLRQYALESPEDFCNYTREAVKSEKFWKNYLASIAGNLLHPTFGMRASLPKIREILNIKGVITHKKKTEMMDRLLDNIYKYRRKKDEKAEAELNYVLSSMDIEVLKMLLTMIPKKQLEAFCKTANTKTLAGQSTMTLEIRYIGKVDRVNKADGMYRLFLHKNYDQIQVHFGLRDAFIIYLIYIIDRYKRNEVDTIKIESYKEQFLKLFEAVYGEKVAGEHFDKLVRHYDAEGKPQQAQIKNCYADIRASVSDGCDKLREIPSPFILSDAQSHLFVLRHKIRIPKNLVELTQ